MADATVVEVHEAYQKNFGRDAELEGLTYWGARDVGHLDNIAAAAQGADIQAHKDILKKNGV